MANWIALVSSIAAAIGLLFTGYQVLLLNRQAGHDRRVVLDGVAVSWRPVESPSRREREDGKSSWLYEVVVANPGRLPIDDVRIRWRFPCEIIRLRHDGITDPPTDTLTLLAPVVIGGGERTWRRRLLIDYAQKNTLINIYAEVTFNDVDGHERTNRWPRTMRKPV